MTELSQSGDYKEMIGTGLKFFGAALEVAGAAFPGIGVLGFVLQGLADAAAAAKYNKELAQALQIKADRVSDAIKGLAADLLQVCVRVRVFACLTNGSWTGMHAHSAYTHTHTLLQASKDRERKRACRGSWTGMHAHYAYTHTHPHLHTHTAAGVEIPRTKESL